MRGREGDRVGRKEKREREKSGDLKDVIAFSKTFRPAARKDLRKEVSNSRRLVFAHSVPQFLMPYS